MCKIDIGNNTNMNKFLLFIIFSAIFTSSVFAADETQRSLEEIHDIKPIPEQALINEHGLEYFDNELAEALDHVDEDDDFLEDEDEFEDDEFGDDEFDDDEFDDDEEDIDFDIEEE